MPATRELPPLGPGPRVDIGVPGAVAVAPSIVARSPLVAVAFATRDSRGAMVYVAVSSDNGATFSSPVPVSDEHESTSGFTDVKVAFADDAPEPIGRPALALEWRTADGRLEHRAVRPFSRRLFRREPAAGAGSSQHSAAVSCEPSGEVLLRGTLTPPLGVSVNHGLAEEACEAGEATAVADVRRWVHAAWIGRADSGRSQRIFYAASSDGEWFGGSQVLADRRLDASRLQVTIDPNDTVVAVWEEAGPTGRNVSMRQVIPAHHGPGKLLPITQLSDTGSGQSPSLASIAGGIIVAWVDDRGTISVKRVGLDAICAPESSPVAAVAPAWGAVNPK